jgi:hypothetical protein
VSELSLQTKNLEVERDQGGGWEWEWQGDGGDVGSGRRNGLDRRTSTMRGKSVSRQPLATLNSCRGVDSLAGVSTHKTQDVSVKTQDVSVSKRRSNAVHPSCQSPVPTITDPLAALRAPNERVRVGDRAETTGEKGGAKTKELDAEGYRLLKSYTAGALCFLIGGL